MDHEVVRFRMLVITVGVFIVSMFVSCSELKYQVYGKSTDAKLVKVSPILETGRRGRGRDALALDYQFTDTDGQVRNEEVTVSKDWQPPEVGESGLRTIQVQYIPGSPGDSRLTGKENWVTVLVFLGITGFLVFQVIRFWRTYQENERRSARSG